MDWRLIVLRAELFAAMQELRGDDLREFWKLIDDVVACRPVHDPDTRT